MRNSACWDNADNVIRQIPYMPRAICGGHDDPLLARYCDKTSNNYVRVNCERRPRAAWIPVITRVVLHSYRIDCCAARGFLSSFQQPTNGYKPAISMPCSDAGLFNGVAFHGRTARWAAAPVTVTDGQ